MINLLAVVDGYILPVIRAANRLRQARDRLPPFAWRLVPVVMREPVDALFAAVEAYELMIGRMIDAGLIPPTGTTTGPDL